MSYTFNPFTGNFDYYQSGSSGISFADLASPPASTALGSSGAKYTDLFLSGDLHLPVGDTRVLFDNSGVIGGDANLLFVKTALAKPGDPVLTAHGGTGTTHCYYVIAQNAIGQSEVNDSQCVSGPATIDNAGNNVEIATQPVPGSTSCVVYRDDGGANTGVIAVVSCGDTVTDVGTFVQQGLNAFYDGTTVDNNTQGAYIADHLHVPSRGDVAFSDVLFGDPGSSFSTIVDTFLLNGLVSIGYHGAATNRVTGLDVLIEATSGNSQQSIQGANFTKATSASPRGILGTAGSSGTGTLTAASGVVGRVASTADAVIADGSSFRTQVPYLPNTGTVTTLNGFTAEDMTGSTSTYGFRGKVASGSGKYNLYMDGTAPNYLKAALSVDAPVTATDFASGTWQGKTFTLGGNLALTGAFNATFAIPSSSTWTFPSGGGTLSTTVGTVTSIATTSPISGGTITSSGTLSLLVNTDHLFTAAQSVTINAIATTSTDGLFLANTTPATSGVAVQQSPRLRFRSQVWNTTSVAATNTNDFFIESVPVSGLVPSGLLKFGSSLNGATATYPMTLSSAGIVASNAASGVPAFVTIGSPAYGVGMTAAGFAMYYNNTGVFIADSANSVRINSASGELRFQTDAIIAKDAANVIAIRNSTSAQIFNVYNTYTSSTSFERLMLDWQTTANVAMIYTQKGSGGGTARVLQFNYGGTTTSAISIPITSGGILFGGGIQSGGDSGGAASTTELTNATNTTITNAYTVKGGQAATTANTGWVKVYIGTTVAWIPYWANATP